MQVTLGEMQIDGPSLSDRDGLTGSEWCAGQRHPRVDASQSSDASVWGWTFFWRPARWAASLQAFQTVLVSMGVITGMPAVAWKQPGAGLSP